MGKIRALCISEKRGTQKHALDRVFFVTEHGMDGDAHAGDWHRQVSLLGLGEIDDFRARGADVDFGAFGENLVAEGFRFKELPIGTRLRVGDVFLEITQIGKECHSHCQIYHQVGDCIMPREGVFARVLHGGWVTVGDEAIIHLTVLNPTGRPLLPARMEMPVGPGTAVFAVPTLRPATIHERGFVLPTARRGVVTVGPVVSVQSDPVGLLRRERTRTQAQLVHIHPRTVRVGSSLHGLMRDVEGAVTQELSSSDVSFHALRDYVPGDDRRNIHWRTTAHTGRLMVRQFEETHRSSLLILLDCLIDDYEVEEDFETAVSVACSLSLDAISDGREVTLATQDEELPTATGLRLLDASCLVTSTAIQGCDDLARQASSRHPEASVIILVTGQRCEEQTLARVRTLTPLDAVVLALRCGSNAMGRRSVGGVTAYDLDRIESLPRIMRRAS